MQTLQKKIEEYTKLTNDIEKLIGENKLEEAQILIHGYSSELQNSVSFAYRSIIEFQLGNVDKALKILDEGIIHHPFSFSLHYNKAFMSLTTHCFETALESYFYAVKYSITDEEKKLAMDGLEETSHEAVKKGNSVIEIRNKMKEFEGLLNQYDAKVYPIDTNGVSMIRRPQKVGSSDEYMINMYDELTFSNVDLQSRMLFKSELIKGEILQSKKVWETKGPVVIPLSKIEHNITIQIKVNGEKYKFTKEYLPMNQFHYIRISEPGNIEIFSDAPIFVGAPIELEPESKPVKLVMKIFVDGLSQQLLSDIGLSEIMPYTYQFFNKGMIAQNCYTVSEWTLPSKSSINTGVYPTKHKMLHPNHLFTYSESYHLLAEYFYDAGYYCTNISTNWRTTPLLGYYRGFDRMIYQNFLGGMDAKEVISETLEHLMTFDKQNNFMTISLMDLHNVPDEIESHLYSQVRTDIRYRLNKNKKGPTSVQTTYDEVKVEKYIQEIRRVDTLLSVLYDFILKNYSDKEISITLHSDHGQSFLEKTFNLLSDRRLKIPFMMRGNNIPVTQSEELIESVDILPAILKSCDLEIPPSIDGQLPKVLGGDEERKYVFTQIIHPGQTYKGKVMERSISYVFETESNVEKDMTLSLKGYKSRVFDNLTGEDVTGAYSDLKLTYDNYIYNNMRDLLKY